MGGPAANSDRRRNCLRRKRHDASGQAAAKARAYFPAERGKFWFAAGLSFTSFAVVDGIVVVAVEFGNGFELNILGLNFGISASGIKLPIIGRIGAPRIAAVLPIEEAEPEVALSAGSPRS